MRLALSTIATLLALSLLPAYLLADEGSPKAFAEQGETPEEEAVYAYLCLDKKVEATIPVRFR
jgi:hypothetical protein